MNRVIFESKLDLITFTLDGHLLHTHKTMFAQRHSLETWPARLLIFLFLHLCKKEQKPRPFM